MAREWGISMDRKPGAARHRAGGARPVDFAKLLLAGLLIASLSVLSVAALAEGTPTQVEGAQAEGTLLLSDTAAAEAEDSAAEAEEAAAQVEITTTLAEEQPSTYDYVISRGFPVRPAIDGPGWRTCYYTETKGAPGVAFSDGDLVYFVVDPRAGRRDEITEDIRQLFLDLVTNYEWDVSFYWPNHEEEIVALSYGSFKDGEESKRNFEDLRAYRQALAELLPPAEPEPEATPEPEPSDSPALESLIEKLDQQIVDVYADQGAERDAINGFFEDLGKPPVGSEPLENIDASACAQYVLKPTAFLCKTGTDSENALTYSTGNEACTADEIWATFGKLLQYVEANGDAIRAAGSQRGGTSANVVIDVCPEDGAQYRAVYDLDEGELSLTRAE